MPAETFSGEEKYLCPRSKGFLKYSLEIHLYATPDPGIEKLRTTQQLQDMEGWATGKYFPSPHLQSWERGQECGKDDQKDEAVKGGWG